MYEQAKLQRELVEALNDLGTARTSGWATRRRPSGSFRRAIELSRAIDHPRGVTVNLMALGDLERRRKRLDEAGALYREALARADAGRRPRQRRPASASRWRSWRRDQGRLDEAVAEADRAVDESRRRIGARPLEGEALFARARGGPGAAAVRRGAARRRAPRRTIAKALGDPELGWRVAYGQGQALEALGRNDEAVAAYRRGGRRSSRTSAASSARSGSAPATSRTSTRSTSRSCSSC